MTYKHYAAIFGCMVILGITALTFELVHMYRGYKNNQVKVQVVKTPRIDDFTNVDRRSFTF